VCSIFISQTSCFSFYQGDFPLDLSSFPTRRSSDLVAISSRASALSMRSNRSVNGVPPSCWLPLLIIAWPYPVEIAGSGSKTAYPAATKGSGFHRYVQAFHEPQGPP